MKMERNHNKHRDTKDHKRLYEQLYENKMDNLEEMDKYLEKCNFPKLNQEEMENLNRPITSTEIETIIKNLPTNKSAGRDGFIGEFYQKFREELTPILLKLLENSRGRKTPKLILQCHHYLIPNQTKNATKKKTTGHYH